MSKKQKMGKEGCSPKHEKKEMKKVSKSTKTTDKFKNAPTAVYSEKTIVSKKK